MTKHVFIVSARKWNGACVTALSESKRLLAEGQSPVVFSRGEADVASRFTRSGVERITLPLGGGLDFVSPVSMASYLRRAPENEIRVVTFTFRDAAIAMKARKLLKGEKRMTVVCRPRYSVMPHLSRQEEQAMREIDLVQLQDGFDKALAERLFSCRVEYYPPSSACFPFEEEKKDWKQGETSVVAPNGGEEKKILYCGRVAVEKGLGDLFSALARLDTDVAWRLIVAGVGSAKDYVAFRNQIRRDGIADKVEWRGFFLDTRPLYEEADIVVVPSLPFFGESLALAEAHACGKKTVVPREDISLAQSLTAALSEL